MCPNVGQIKYSSKKKSVSDQNEDQNELAAKESMSSKNNQIRKNSWKFPDGVKIDGSEDRTGEHGSKIKSADSHVSKSDFAKFKGCPMFALAKQEPVSKLSNAVKVHSSSKN